MEKYDALINEIARQVDERLAVQGVVSVKMITQCVERMLNDDHDYVVACWLAGKTAKGCAGTLEGAPFTEIESVFDREIDENEESTGQIVHVGMTVAMIEAMESDKVRDFDEITVFDEPFFQVRKKHDFETML